MTPKIIPIGHCFQRQPQGQLKDQPNAGHYLSFIFYLGCDLERNNIQFG